MNADMTKRRLPFLQHERTRHGLFEAMWIRDLEEVALKIKEDLS